MDPIKEVDVASNPLHWLFVIGMNLVVLAELCIAMYLAAADPDDFTATFIKSFFAMLVPTLVVGSLTKRRLRSAHSAGRTCPPVEQQRLTS